MLFALLAQVISVGGSTDVRARSDPCCTVGSCFAMWGSLVADLPCLRPLRFEHTPGATAIAPGAALPSPPGRTAIAPADVASATRAMGSRPLRLRGRSYDSRREMRPSRKPEPIMKVGAVAATTAGFAALFLRARLGRRSVSFASAEVAGSGSSSSWIRSSLTSCFWFAIVYCTRSLRGRKSRVTPLCTSAIAFLATAGPLVYTVTNFVRCFECRRKLLYVMIAALPLTSPTHAKREDREETKYFAISRLRVKRFSKRAAVTPRRRRVLSRQVNAEERED